MVRARAVCDRWVWATVWCVLSLQVGACGRVGFGPLDRDELAIRARDGSVAGEFDARLPAADAQSADSAVGLDGGARPDGGGSTPPIDGGTSGGSDAGPGSGVCASDGVLLCDDFELGTVSPFTPGSVDGDGVYDTANPFAGARSFRETTTNNGGQAFITAGLPGAPIATGSLYLRMQVYLPSGYSISWTGVMSLCSQDGGGCVVLSISQGGALATLQVSRMTGSEDMIDATVPVVRDRWTCFAAAIDVAETGGNVTFTVDGVQVSSLTNIDTVPREGGYNEIYFGIPYTTPAQGPVRVFIDDVAFGTQPLPCP